MTNIKQNSALCLLGIFGSRTAVSVGLLFIVSVCEFLTDSTTLAAAANQDNWGAPKVQVL